MDLPGGAGTGSKRLQKGVEREKLRRGKKKGPQEHPPVGV